MNLKTLLNKTGDAVKLIMTQPTMIFKNKSNITLVNEAHVVNEDETARPDLIALQYYGNQSKLDVILKWNGISDPMSLNEGDVLEIPSANVPFFRLERPKNFDDNPVKQQFVDGKRLSKKDQRRLDALKKKYGKDNLLPPNVIPLGKKNYEFVGTRIRMGAQAQNDAVVDGINGSLNGNGDGTGDGINGNGGGTEDVVGTVLELGGENIGSEFEKIPGGVWTWLGSAWLPVDPKVAQEVAGSLYGEHGNPNGAIEGSFEGQLYFDKLRGDGNGTGGTTDSSLDDSLSDGQGNTNADGPAGSGTSGVGNADGTGDNQNDGGNPPPSGGNTNNGNNGNNGGGGSSSPCA